MHHDVYHPYGGVLDLGKMKEEAERKARGDFYSDPETTTIHFHAADAPCNRNEPEKHLLYGFEGKTDGA
jgi:hypothetical protein